MTFEALSGSGPRFDFPPTYPPISYGEATEIPPEEGLQAFGGMRPYAINDTELGATIIGLDGDGQVVERVLGDMSGIIESIGAHVVFGYAHKTMEPSQRVVKPLGIWRGVHEGHTGQAPTWYLIAEDRARKNPTTGIITAVDSAIKYFSFACLQRGPIGDAANPDFRASQGLPAIA
jgi:hypothetical protein